MSTDKKKREPKYLDDWLSLPSAQERIEAMHPHLRDAVRNAHRGRWSTYDGRTDNKNAIRAALSDVLASGARPAKDVLTLMNASIRAKDKGLKLSNQSIENIAATLAELPHYAVVLYAKYGCDALRVWQRDRLASGETQARWDDARELAAVQSLKELYSGVPSVGVLQQSGVPALRGLAQRLHKRGAMQLFAKKHGLDRALKNVPVGLWGTEEQKTLLSDSYAELCRSKGRYVPNYELSSAIASVPCTDGSTFAGNTLRVYIRQHLGVSVQQLFESLCQSGVLPKEWKSQVKIAISSDGTMLDSWTEVRWWEACRSAIGQLPAGKQFDQSDIAIHPRIGTSKLKGDFALNHVFVEVLRHSFASIECPQTADATAYAEKLANRIKAYGKQKIRYFLVEPAMLADAERLSQHFKQWFSAALGRAVRKLHVQTASEYPPGYWHVDDHRDVAIYKVIDAHGGPPGRYPPFRAIIDCGFGGLEAFLRKTGTRPDRQTEAVRVSALVFPYADKSPRLPTEDELLAVCRFHAPSLLNADDEVTPQTLKATFGENALDFLKDVQVDICGFLTGALREAD
ncbi:hypothetical protein [Paraburkholderia bannensis]|uniref:hypothetical protein n=1 Tax=Paraburkholderia bannensis TaxID=765414 RepID=UPI002ABDA999|nr:hypothetical protein [Paraburkholderia bannensis]